VVISDLRESCDGRTTEKSLAAQMQSTGASRHAGRSLAASCLCLSSSLVGILATCLGFLAPTALLLPCCTRNAMAQALS